MNQIKKKNKLKSCFKNIHRLALEPNTREKRKKKTATKSNIFLPYAPPMKEERMEVTS